MVRKWYPYHLKHCLKISVTKERPVSSNFYVGTCVKFTFATKIEAMHERSLVSVKVEPRSTPRLSSALFILPSILFTWLKFTVAVAINLYSQPPVLHSFAWRNIDLKIMLSHAQRLSYMSSFCPEWGVLPYISHIGMCRSIRWGFCAVLVWKQVYTLPILVWNRKWVSREPRSVWTYLPLKFQMSKKEREICKFEIDLNDFFVCALI